MKYAIEFTLDENLRNKIFRYWKHLWEQGFAAPQTEARPYEPHISLLVFEDYLDSIFKGIDSIDYTDFDNSISFHSFGIFKHEYSVLFLTPRTEFNWIDIQTRHYTILKDQCKNIWDFYYPNRWNPHCSLTVNKSYEKILEALKSLDFFSFPLEGKIDKISLIDFKEGKTIHSRNIL